MAGSGPRTVDESCRQAFRAAIGKDLQVDLTSFLPPLESSQFAVTLEALVAVDLEQRWKRSPPGPLVEEYVDRFPVLALHEATRRLAVHEFCVRSAAGDPVEPAEFLHRFEALGLTARDLQCPAAVPSPQAETPVASQEERYDIVEEHARGGMGVILRAVDRVFRREVAIKKLAPQVADDATCVSRFIAEAATAARLEHPGVVPVYDQGYDEEGRPFYVMKLVQGRTLSDLIKEHHQCRSSEARFRIDSARLLQTLLTVSRTVAYAHQRGILHRDLKPDNVIVGAHGETVLLDWGLSKRDENEIADTSHSVESSPHATAFGTVLGTPYYMAPEQAAGEVTRIDQRTDVYGLGAILFQILTGEPPLRADNIQDLLSRTAAGEVRSPRALDPNLPRAIDAICRKALAAAAQDRYASADEFAEELERFTADEPVRAYAEPWTIRCIRWGKRHRTLVTTSAVGVVLICTATILGLLQWQRALQQRLAYLDRLRTSARASQSLALAEIRTGIFATAADRLSRARQAIGEEESLHVLIRQLDQQKRSATQLAEFYEFADRGEELAFYEHDADTIVFIEQALQRLNVFEHYDWWRHLTDLQVSPQVQDRLQGDAYRLLVGLTVQYMKAGLLQSLSLFSGSANETEGQKWFEKARLAAETASRFRHAELLRFCQDFCDWRLGRTADVPRVTNLQPRNEVDQYGIGLCLLFAHVYSDAPLARTMISQLVGIDDLAGEAERLLYEASIFHAERYWNAVLFGWAELVLKKPERALAAFSRAVAIKPDYYFSYVWRAHALAELANKSTAETERQTFIQQALRDLRRAVELAPGNSRIYFRRALILRDIPGEELAVVEALLSAIRLEPPLDLLPKGRRRDEVANALMVSLEHARRVTDELAPNSPDAWLLRAFAALALELSDEASTALRTAMEIDPESSIGLSIRGDWKWQSGAHQGAVDDWKQAARIDPANFWAQWGVARALPLDAPRDSLVHHRRLRKLAENDWQQVIAMVGESAALARLGRMQQSLQVIDEASSISPRFFGRQMLLAANDVSDAQYAEAVRLRLEDHPQPRALIAPGPGYQAALLNGGFELGLERHWGQPPLFQHVGGVWWNLNGSRATAQATGLEHRSGRLCLQVRSDPLGTSGGYSMTHQQVPIIPDSQYRLSLWAKTARLQAPGAEVKVSAGGVESVAAIDTGTHDWRQYDTSFAIDADEATVAIVVHGSGTVWIDDLELELIED